MLIDWYYTKNRPHRFLYFFPQSGCDFLELKTHPEANQDISFSPLF